MKQTQLKITVLSLLGFLALVYAGFHLPKNIKGEPSAATYFTANEQTIFQQAVFQKSPTNPPTDNRAINALLQMKNAGCH